MIHRTQSLTAAEIANLVGDSPVMLEIGANDGHHTNQFLSAMPGIRLFCFEPGEVAKFWHANVSCKRARLFRVAVSDIDGFEPWYTSGGIPDCRNPGEWNQSSSICEPTGHYKKSPEITFKHAGEVPAVRLDTWFAGQGIHQTVDFIWADVQGAEAKMIRGGQETLKRTRWVYTEFYNTPMYAGQPNLAEIHALLPGGVEAWELVGIYGGENALFRNRQLA